jgi:PhzF family phenazine biosynthesis protein
VRIFSPGRELPFAGHPTLGSCHAWLEAGGQSRGEIVVQECGIGLVKLRRDGQRLAFAAPPLRRSGPLPEEDVALIARGLGIARADIVGHAWCDNGPAWRGVLLASAQQVLALHPDASLLAGLDVAWSGRAARSAWSVRARRTTTARSRCAPSSPATTAWRKTRVTGSLNAALAQWLIGAGLAPQRYIASQGTALGRAGRVHVERDAQGETWIGGASVTCVDGQVRF